METRRFETRLGAEGENLFIEVPFDVKAAFGRARPPVIVTVNGLEFRSTVAVYGGRSYLPLRRDRRDALGVKEGDRVQVTIALDEAPRTVEPTKDLAAALRGNAAAKASWEALSFSKKSELVVAIEEAKKPETRARRVAKAIAELVGKLAPENRRRSGTRATT